MSQYKKVELKVNPYKIKIKDKKKSAVAWMEEEIDKQNPDPAAVLIADLMSRHIIEAEE